MLTMIEKIIISPNSNQERFIPNVLSTPLSKKLILCQCVLCVAVYASVRAMYTRSASAACDVSNGTQRDKPLGSEGVGIKLS